MTGNLEAAHKAYLSLGSNIEPQYNLPRAVGYLSQFGLVRKASTVWETLPVGPTGQPIYLNAAVLLQTSLSAKCLRLEVIARVEVAMGRIRTGDRYAPRTIDIDIMLFDRAILDIGHRHIPDPEIYERKFVALTLAEIAPDYVHPETGQTLQEIALRFGPPHAGMRRRDDIVLFTWYKSPSPLIN